VAAAASVGLSHYFFGLQTRNPGSRSQPYHYCSTTRTFAPVATASFTASQNPQHPLQRSRFFGVGELVAPIAGGAINAIKPLGAMLGGCGGKSVQHARRRESVIRVDMRCHSLPWYRRTHERKPTQRLAAAPEMRPPVLGHTAGTASAPQFGLCSCS
jgi:hypothetical protein